MLKEQEHVAEAARRAEGDKLLLEAERLRVIDPAEIEVLDHKPTAIVARRLRGGHACSAVLLGRIGLTRRIGYFDGSIKAWSTSAWVR